ncbi:MAG: hypothetical protein V5A44_07935 [Haloarculaceae archaeon]
MDQKSDDIDDTITRRALSDSAYDRIRIERFTHFRQSIPRKLAIVGVLLGSLTLALPLYSLYPVDAAAYVSSIDPAVASPTVVLLGVAGVGIEFGTAVLLVGAGLYRARNEPLTESQAVSVFNVENFATYVGFGTGGFVVAVTLVLFTLGLGGEESLAWYTQTMASNPFRPTGLGFTVTHFTTVALAGALAIALAREYVATRLPR